MFCMLLFLLGSSGLFASAIIPESWPGYIQGENMVASIQMFCGRDENGTILREPAQDYCEKPRYTTYPSSGGYGIGTLFRGGRADDYGRISGHISYFQIAPASIGYSCDGVLLIDSMSKTVRPRPDDRYALYAAENVETLGVYGYGKYTNSPRSLGMRCFVENLTDFESSNSVYGVRHGRIYGCTICEELVPFDCPTEFEKWYLDSDLMYRDGNVCDRIYGDTHDPNWFPFIEYYYSPGITMYFAYGAEVAELGRDHPFMPGHFCSEDECPCSLPSKSPVYPDSLFGGTNPKISFPVTLSGYPYHSRTLGRRISGTCTEAIVQAVFKLSADASWDDANATIEYGRINKTELVSLNEIRRDLLTPGIYSRRATSDWPLIPKMSGLMNARSFRFAGANYTLTRCLIKPNTNFTTEEEQHANGQPYNCVTCIHEKDQCVAPVPKNGTTGWILDTTTGFTRTTMDVASITIPPGFEVILAAYNASDDTPVARSQLPIGKRNATEILQDDPDWALFTYCINIRCASLQ